MWESEVWDRTELQHIDPHSYGHNSVSFLFSWAAQLGSWGSSLSGTGSSFQHLLSNCNCSIGGPEGPLCSVLVLSTASYLQLIWTSCRQGYIIIWHPLFFLRVSQFCTQFHPSTVKVISWNFSTGCTCYLNRCISYLIAWPGRRSIYNIMNELSVEIMESIVKFIQGSILLRNVMKGVDCSQLNVSKIWYKHKRNGGS